MSPDDDPSGFARSSRQPDGAIVRRRNPLSFKTKLIAGGVAALLLIAGGAFSSLCITGFFTAGISTDTRDTKTVESFEFKQDITLVSLGINGTQVNIMKTGEHSYSVSIPAFEFMGMKFSNQDGEGPFKKIDTANGILSFVTADIDESVLYSRIVTDQSAQLIADNEQHLRSQAEVFFTGIITAVDPEASIDFEFAEQPTAKE